MRPAYGANTAGRASMPRAAASRRRLACADRSSCESHKTLPCTRAKSRIQTSKTGAEILVLLLKQQNTRPRSGRPSSLRVGDLRRYAPGRIVGVIAIRQMHDPFGEERLLIERQHGLVGENVVDEVGPGRCGIAEIDGLDRAPRDRPGCPAGILASGRSDRRRCAHRDRSAAWRRSRRFRMRRHGSDRTS